MTSAKRKQAGSFMLEALIGILLFFLGALAMIALQANGVAAQTDAEYRIEASNLANRMLGEITVAADRSNPAIPTVLQDSLVPFEYNATTDGNCDFSGGPANPPDAVEDWNTDIAAKIPSSSAAMRQILVDTATFNQVTVTICWRTAADATPRRHSVTAYIN